MSRVKTVNTSVFVTFAIILILFGVVIYNYDFETGLDRDTDLENLRDYIHKSDVMVVDAKPEEITSVYAYLTNEGTQIRFEYGRIFMGDMHSDCSEKGSWAHEAAVPADEINLNEQEIAEFTKEYSEIKPEYYVNDDNHKDKLGFGNLVACILIRTETNEYFLQIGEEYLESGYRYLNAEEKGTLYLMPSSVLTRLTNLRNTGNFN